MADFDFTSLIGPALGVGASLWSANQNKKAAQQAQEAQRQGAQVATQAQQPYVDVGQRAAALLNNEDITKLPGYQSGLDAGLAGIDRAAAARGGFNTGNRQRALVKYATDYNAAKTADRENQLMRLLGIGGAAAGNVGNIATGYGDAAGRSAISQSNSGQSGLTSALDIASKYLTSKGSNGQTNGANLWSTASNGLTTLLGGSTPSSYESKPWGDTNFANESDWWA